MYYLGNSFLDIIKLYLKKDILLYTSPMQNQDCMKYTQYRVMAIFCVPSISPEVPTLPTELI